ncbi:MAG: PAS domain S-box protein [Candidatus Cloacimonetes bacterium]|nr:PAS domain S-box protein [Candidatus Cloacimonadota bacterium]
MNKILKVLLLEDNIEDAELIIRELKKSDLNIEPKVTHNESAYIQAIQEFKPDIILSDYALPGYDGMRALMVAEEKVPDIPFIIVTGSINEETAVQCIKKGAWDYVIKQHLHQLVPAVRNAIKYREELIQKREREEELRNTLELTKAIIDNSQDCIKILDLEGNLLYMSIGGQRLLEIKDVNKYLNKNWIEFWEGEDRKKAQEAVNKAKKGKVGYFEGYCPTEKGTPKWWGVLISPIYDDAGKVEKLLSVSRDITSRKEIEQRLLRSEVQKDIILNTTQEMFAFYDINLRIIWANKASADSVGIPPEEMVGKYCYEVWQKRKEPCEGCIVLKAKETKQPQSGKAQTHDGRYWSLRGYPVLDEEGNVTNLIELGMDITEREKAEKQLEQVLEATTDGIWTWNFKTDELHFSPKYYTMLGYEPDEFPATYDSWVRLLHPRDKDEAIKTAEEYLQEKPDVYENQFRMRTKDGTYLCIHALAKVVERDTNGEAILMIGNHEDITGRKQAERKFQTYVTSSPTPFFIANSIGEYTYVNNAACHLLGYSEKELLSMNIKDVSHPDDYEKNLKTFSKLLEGKPVRQEISMLHKSGKKVYSILDAVMLDENNIIAFCTDTTQRHHDEEVQNVLYKISEAVNTTTNLDELYHSVHEHLSHILDVKNFYIVLYNKEHDILEFPFHADEKVTFKTHAAENTLSGYVITNGKSLYADRKVLAKLQKEGKIGKADKGTEAQIWIGVPLKYENETIGVLAVQNYTNEKAFSKDDVRILELVSNTIALGIERKKFERYLFESEEKYRTLVNNLPVGISRSTPAGKLLALNPAIVEMYGYSSSEELMKADAKELYCDSKDREHMLSELKKHGFVKGSVTQEYKKDGSKIWVSANYKATFDKRGEIEYLDGVILDITKRKKALEALEESERKLKETVGAIAEGVWEINLRTNSMYFSPQYYHMLGYEPYDFEPSIEKSRELIHPDDREEAVRKEIELIETSQENYVDEFRMISKNGGYRWIRTKGKVVEWDEKDMPVRIIGSHEDITYEKLAEMELQRTQENFINIVESNLDGILILDVKGRIGYSNPAAQNLFGKKEKELIGSDFEFYHMRDNGKEIQINDEKGRTKIASIIVTKVKWEESERPLIVLHDITNRKEFENKLRETNKKLEELMAELEKKVEKQVKELREKDHIIIEQSRHAAMGEMIGNIAHQWRQPLTAVAAIVQDIEEAYKYGELDEKYLRESIKITMDQIGYMSRTIDDFRNFFLPNKEKENFSINEAVTSTVKFIESSFKHNEIKIDVDIVDQCIVRGFQNEYTQVILNIMNNAKDAVKRVKPAHAHVRISLKQLKGQKYSSSLTISNNAGQIPKTIMKKIFDPYFTTKHESEGTGLGLYMSKMIIEKNMGGSIAAENIKDGVKFTILL